MPLASQCALRLRTPIDSVRDHSSSFPSRSAVIFPNPHPQFSSPSPPASMKSTSQQNAQNALHGGSPKRKQKRFRIELSTSPLERPVRGECQACCNLHIKKPPLPVERKLLVKPYQDSNLHSSPLFLVSIMNRSLRHPLEPYPMSAKNPDARVEIAAVSLSLPTYSTLAHL